MIKIRVTPSQLEKGKITEVRYSRSKSIKDYLEGIDLTGQKVIVSGKVIKDLNKKPKNGDQIIVCPDVKAPVIGAIVGAVVAWVVAHPIIAVLTFVMIGFAIYSAVTAKSRMPNFGTVGDGLDASSPTYGWEGIRTIQEVGTPVPVVYGRHRVGGNIINQYVSTDGDKQYLNLLIALCEGEIEDISTIKINGNPIENYTGISTYLRYGTNSQAVIQHFEDLHNDYPISIPLVKNDAYIYTTIDNDVEAFEINLSLPNGLFYTDSSSGSIYAWSVTYKVEYKLHADSTWIDLGNTTISAKSRTTLRRVFRKEGLTAGQYDIRITRISDNGDFYHTGDLYLSSIDEIKTDDLIYPNTALLGIRALATEQLSGSTPNITSLVEGRLISAPNVLYEDGGAAVAWEDYYYDPDTSSFKLLADDTVLFWGGDYIEQFCANPIWCLKDLQLNTRYGLGEYIDMAQLDETKLLEMALYCEGKVPNGEDGYEKRFRLDVVIDSRAKALDILTQICAAFRAFAFYSDGKIQFKIDAPEEVTQLFGMGNIIAGSFQQGWKSIKEVPNVIEVIYMDQDLDYQQEQIAVIDETALAAGDPIRKKQLRIFTTKTSYAIREGRYALWLAKYINRSVSFRAGIEAVACQAGDVIVISHDVPQWSFSGRTKEGSTTSLIKLDRTITIEDNKTYMIGIRHADDTLETGIVTDSPGYYTEVNISEALETAPAEGDIYIFGDVNTIAKLFRIIGIKREGAGEVQITAIEYNESVYDDSAVVLPTNNYSSLSNTIPNVLGLTLTERIVKMGDGTIEDVIDVWFTRPDLSSHYLKRYAKAKIYISEDNGVSWTYRGETTGTHFAIQGDIYDLKTYIVAVVSVSDKGEENSIDDSAQETITVLGKTAPPDDITGFDVYQEGNLLKFVWDANDDADLARYIIKKGNDWTTGQVIAEKVDTTDFMYPVGEVGLQTYMIKAVDTSGNESTNPAYDTLTVIPPPEMNFINNFDLWSVPLDYKISDLERVWANFHDKDFNRIALALRTADTWETREAEAQTWEYQEANAGLILDEEFVSSGSFEMITPYDLQTIFNFKIVVDADYAQGTNCTVTIQISTSEDGITYTAFEDIDADKSYQARYLKFKVLISSTNTAYNAYLFDALIYINAPTVKVSWGKDIVIPIAGKSVLFDAGFTLPPRVIANIVNGVVGIIKISNKTKDGMTIEALNLSGENIGTAEVDYDARGYVWIIGFILNSLILGGLLACIL